jgi:putative ABC transport system permease protein
MGTTRSYFTNFKYGMGEKLVLREGAQFNDVYTAVLGAEVAKSLGYSVGDSIVLSHGAGEASFIDHGDKPFTVTGILKPTGTPVDRTVHVPLEGIEAIHIGWNKGTPGSGMNISAEHAKRLNLTPKVITAFFVKLKSPLATFSTQRLINQYPDEPLTAILPGVALQQLWKLIGTVEKALIAISGCVVVVGLFGMVTALLTSLNERRREMAILRSIGARPSHVFSLIIGESVVVTLLGIITGVMAFYLALLLARPFLLSRFGLPLQLSILSPIELALLGLILFAGLLSGIIPGVKLYRHSLNDGMTITT